MKGRTQRPELHPELCGICHVCQDGCPGRVFPDLSFESDTIRARVTKQGQSSGKPAQPPCRQACPIGQDIPGYLSRIAAGDPYGALAWILRYNPFPAVLGYVCHHPCEKACISGSFQRPPAIRDLKRFASMAKRPEVRRYSGPSKGRIAVIGAGPAGLSAAWALSRSGVQVTVYESAPAPGGLLTWAIPPFRLPRKAVQEDISYILQHGVVLKLNSYIPSNELKSLQAQYDAVILACGASDSRQSEIPGSDLPGIWSGLDFLREMAFGPVLSINPPVMVIGGGNVATDAARWAARLTAQVVLLYRRDRADMLAYPEEIDAAADEGVELVFRWQPVDFEGDARNGVQQIRIQETSPGREGKDGRRIFTPLFGTKKTVPVRTVILALGQERNLTKWGEALKTGNDSFNQSNSSAQWIYTAGDIVTGPATVVEAIAGGIGCADRILREVFQ